MKFSQSLNRLIALLFLFSLPGCSNDDDMHTDSSLPSTPYADLEDVVIYFKVYGNGDPVLMLHGGFSNSDIWEFQIEALSKHYQVITMDSRGHGRSTDSDAPITYENLADDAVRMLDYLGLEKAHVIGWSDGGVAGLIMGINNPERLGKLVTIGATTQGLGSLVASSEAMLENQDLFNLLMEVSFKSDYEAMNPEPQWEVFRDKMFNLWTGECYLPNQAVETCMDALADINSAVLVIAGEDETVRRDHTEAIAQRLANADLLIIPGGTHFVMQEKPAEVNAAILDFLAD